MTPLDGGHDDVERGKRALELQPGEAAAARRVRAERILHHQALVTPRPGLREDPVEVVGAGRLLDAREEERMLEAKPFEQLAPLLERLVEQRAAVEPQEVEDDQRDRHVAPQRAVDLLASEAALELEEPQHPT